MATICVVLQSGLKILVKHGYNTVSLYKRFSRQTMCSTNFYANGSKVTCSIDKYSGSFDSAQTFFTISFYVVIKFCNPFCM